MQEFDKIYSEYFTHVYKFVMALCRDRQLAEEITQEAFFRALKNIDNFKGNARIESWLCRIAKNTYFDHMKKEKRQADFPIEITISEESIEKRIENRQTAFEIHKTLHRLKEPYKEVFWLRTFGDLSFSQIASLFDKTESWARVTYYRAKIMIKEQME